MMRFASFEALVRRATRTSRQPEGFAPYRYQERLAEEGFPDVLSAPTGSGKTAVVLAFLWRLLGHPDATVRAATPRRLIIALPSRTLVEQYEQTISGWLENLGLIDTVGVTVLMGGRDIRSAQQEWRVNLHRPSIVIGTVDMVVSRALMRGYGAFRASYPIDFALVCNGSLIVVDEVQLTPHATATLRQLAAFQKTFGTAEPAQLMVMSATVDDRVLDTFDNPFDGGGVMRVEPGEESSELQRRLAGERTVRELPPTAKPAEFAQQIMQQHVPGTLTLVVVNQVETAVETYKALGKLIKDEKRLLIHSQFRGVERDAQLHLLRQIAAEGGIVVATQAIEAGVDIDARTLITEAAPWPSMVQRAGRCNRAARWEPGEATVWWRKPANPAPYDPEQVDHSVQTLIGAEGRSLTSGQFHELGAHIPPQDLSLRILRRRDFLQLFDTTPDLSGSDVDIHVYIRSEQDQDVSVAWVPDGTFDTSGDEVVVPPQALRCGVSISRFKKLLHRKGDSVRAWTYQVQTDRWVPVTASALRPQQLVLVEASSGGYSTELGFEPTSKTRVEVALPSATVLPEGVTSAQDTGAGADGWVTLSQHLTETREQAEALATALAPQQIDAADLHAAAVAAFLHDIGKAHKDWNDALVTANADTSPPDPGQVYAKSPGRAPLRVMRDLPANLAAGAGVVRMERRAGFRHELASVFMLRSDIGRRLLTDLGVPVDRHALVAYLIGAHHGHIRLTARDPQYDGIDGVSFLGCFDGETINPVSVPGVDLPESHVDLSIFHPGEDSWTTNALDSLDRLGPFRLAYLEALVRMADWRASARLPIVTETGVDES